MRLSQYKLYIKLNFKYQGFEYLHRYRHFSSDEIPGLLFNELVTRFIIILHPPIIFKY